MRKTRLIAAPGPFTDAIQILPGGGFHPCGNRAHWRRTKSLELHPA
jgi:hypothetical protein